MSKRALISVSDKTGITELAGGLRHLDYEIISTGGTAAHLKQAGIEVTDVSDVTGFPECLDGRVKTLSPIIHAGILADRDNEMHMKQLAAMGVETIDIVVINLYPFKQTVAKPDVTMDLAIENIDIGGPTMLRSAAKNWKHVCVIVDPEDYIPFYRSLNKNQITPQVRFELSRKVFQHTASYDSAISTWMSKQVGDEYPASLSTSFDRVQNLRYGENPHQTAAFYKQDNTGGATVADAQTLQGKELSFNNIHDTAAALSILREFDGTKCAVAVKHCQPCGVGTGDTVGEAFERAYNADPVSIFGGIVALNTEVDAVCAKWMAEIFLEVIIAPSYTPDALDILGKKKNMRVLLLPGILNPLPEEYDIKKVPGGILVQSMDKESIKQLEAVTERTPTKSEMAALLFGWNVVKHTRSNAIVLSTENQTVGVGPGQTNRVGALEIAIRTGVQDMIKGSVMASDAFFPFEDCVELAAAAGITAIIQPGGSKNDKLSIDKCNELGIAMVFTGTRHFKH